MYTHTCMPAHMYTYMSTHTRMWMYACMHASTPGTTAPQRQGEELMQTGRGWGVSEISCHCSMYIRLMTPSVSRTVARSLSLTHTQAFVYPRTAHLPIIRPPIHSISHLLTLFLSLFLSGMYVRACARVPLSIFLSISSLHSLSGFLSVSFFLFYTHTRAHAVTCSLSSTHTQTHTRTKSLSPSFSLTHTHFSLFLSLTFLSLAHSLFLFFLSFFHSLSLSLSLTLIHTHFRAHILSHLFTRSSTHSLLSRVRAALSSVRVRARAICFLFLSPFLPFLFFSFVILSLWLSSSPLAGLLFRRLSLTRLLPLFFNSW